MSCPTSQSVTTQILDSPVPTVRYFSGLTLYEEQLVGGRWEPAYWSPRARIETPEELRARRETPHYPRLNAFSLTVDGQALVSGWQWAGAEEAPDERSGGKVVTVRLRHDLWPVQVAVHTLLDGTAILTRWLEITNTGDQPQAISACEPLVGILVWRDGGAYPGDLPDPICSLGHMTGVQWGDEGAFSWMPLPAGRHGFTDDRGKSCYQHPFFVARNDYTGESLVLQLEWSTNWSAEFEYRPGLGGAPTANDRRALVFRAGHAGEAPLYVLDPGETVPTMRAHVSYLYGDLDACVQQAHAHQRRSVLLPRPEGQPSHVTYNHWGYMQHELSEARVQEEIDVAAALGAEVFIVDAGWYADAGTKWWTTVGDWTPGGRLPNGFGPLVDYAHKQGLLFGAWMEAERIGSESRAYAAHPEWVLRYAGQELDTGPLDLTLPDCAAWMEAEICRVIEEYRLDLFRLDHNVYVWQGGQREHAGFRESTLWRQCLALWGIFDRVHQRFPAVILENCAGGGGRTDLGMQRRFQYVQISDCTALPRALRIMNGSTMFLPPEACFNFTGVCMDAHVRGDLDSQLRGVMMGKPCLSGFAPAPEQVDPVTRERVRHHVAVYKESLRPLHADSLVYHHTPELTGVEPAGWWVQEYFSPSLRRGAVGLFRLVNDGRDTWQFQARGVRRDKTYRVTFDNSGETVEMTGQALRDQGLAIRLPGPMSSELMLLEER